MLRSRITRELYTNSFRKLLECLWKIHSFNCLIKTKNISASLTGESIRNSLIRGNKQAGIFVRVKRAQALVIPSGFFELTILSHKIFYRQTRFDVGNGIHRYTV